MLKKLLSISIVFFVTPAFSKSEQEINQEAVQNTQQVLKSPTERQKTLDTPNAKKSADNVKKISGGDPELEQAIWELSSELLPVIVEASNGDPQKMQEYLSQARSNPKAFADRFPAAQREKLRAIAEKIALKHKSSP